MRRRLMLRNASGGGKPVLPDAYQRCEWVGVSYNRKQRFINISDDILTKADLANYVFSFTMGNISDKYSASVQTVGIVCGTSANAGCYVASQGNLLGMGYDTIGQYSSTPKRDYEMRWTSTGGTVYSGSDVIATRNFIGMTGDQRFAIGSPNNVNYPYSFECYKAKIIHQNAVIVDLIPCYRKSDNAIGFYDVVGNVFRFNTGNFAFNAKGVDVN